MATATYIQGVPLGGAQYKTNWMIMNCDQCLAKHEASMFWGKGCGTTELHGVAWFPEPGTSYQLRLLVDLFDQDQNAIIFHLRESIKEASY